MRITFLIAVLNFAQVITDEMEGRVVNGGSTVIKRHPHSVYLFLQDKYNGGTFCGGSIVNQRVVLTAAHCFDKSTTSRNITAIVGSSFIERGLPILVIVVRIHPHYELVSARNDIALAGLKDPIVLGMRSKRVAIAQIQPDEGIAILAGWGAVQDFPRYEMGSHLRVVAVPFMSREVCQKVLSKHMNEGTFCGGEFHAKSYPSVGDSGSPLVLNDYLQIGLVSCRSYRISSMIIYTDVPYFYDWIMENAKTLFCKKKN